MPRSKPAPAINSAVQTAAQRSPTTLASTVYDRLGNDILMGELAPGHKLRIEFLSTRYHTGQIPLREALNRLSSNGLVEHRDQRGLLVAPLDVYALVE